MSTGKMYLFFVVYFSSYLDSELVSAANTNIPLDATMITVFYVTLVMQFTASSAREAREWVDQINFVLRGKLHVLLLFKSHIA